MSAAARACRPVGKTVRALLLVVALAGILQGTAAASTAWIFGQEEPPKRRSYRDRMNELLVQFDMHPAAGKLGRGLANIATGWLEIPVNMQRYYSEHDQATGLFTGLVVGIVRAVGRTGVGAYETATFFLPYPERYEPILPPLEYFTDEGKDLIR